MSRFGASFDDYDARTKLAAVLNALMAGSTFPRPP
jgi:hypothetical protein